jgi:predicted secreted protein
LATSDGGYLLAGASASDISGDQTQAGRGGLDYWIAKTVHNGSRNRHLKLVLTR